MNLKELFPIICSSFSAIFAGITIIVSIVFQRKNWLREKKQNTIDAYLKLQENALTELYSHPKSFYEDIALDNQSDEYKYYSSLIAQCEHFATCIVEEVYDFDILLKISKKHLVYVYEKTYPIIEQAQYSDRFAFSNFEDLVCGLKWKRDCKKQSNENPGFTKK